MILTYTLRQYTDTKRWYFEQETSHNVPVVVTQRFATIGDFKTQDEAIAAANFFFAGVKTMLPDLKLGISPE